VREAVTARLSEADLGRVQESRYDLTMSAQREATVAGVGDAASPFLNMADYEKYPASLSIEYLPRVTDAANTQKTVEMYLFVKRKNTLLHG
jgi:hypothetical protein